MRKYFHCSLLLDFFLSYLSISQFSFLLSLCTCRQWEEELARARKSNRKPRLRNALFSSFWKSCVVDGFLVFSFAMLKSIMPLFLAQLLLQFQLPPTPSSKGENLNETSLDEFVGEIKNISSIVSDDVTVNSTVQSAVEFATFVW